MQYTELLNSAKNFVRDTGEITKKYFKAGVQVFSKCDDTPVTIADKEAEQHLRKLIEGKYPSHGIIGEEYGEKKANSDFTWVIDPIDGTKSFIHGIPTYTLLIGILKDNKPLIGIVYAPETNELCAACVGNGATLNNEPCTVRNTKQLAEATLLTTDLDILMLPKHKAGFEELLSKTKLHRTWGDAYGHMMVATGRADIMIDPVLNLWDAAALLPVVTEAGGVYTDFSGISSIHTGSAISCIPALHSLVLNAFK